MADSETARPLRVFLCHARDDKPAVRRLYKRLRADGIDAWFDEENLIGGQNWRLEIPKAVRQSDVVLVCLTPRSINKEGYVQKEIRLALDAADEKPEGTIFLIPLRLEDCDVPERLSRWQWVNLFSPNGFERLMRALQVRATSLGLGASPTPPSAAPASQSKADTTPAQSVSNVSGGVNIEGQQVSVGNDVVGRDKIVQANTYIEHATSVQSTPQVRDMQVVPPAKYSIEIRKSGGMEFVRVPAGKFLMGSQDDDPQAYANEMPQHTVEIPYDYWMARYLVTHEQFAKFVEAAAYKFDFIKNWKTHADHPVVDVSWDDATAYCKWLNEQLRSDLGELILRLPTEAEWEKAARGEYGNKWPWGNKFDKNKCNGPGGSTGDTTRVGAYSPQGDSPYGATDMVGNVWEWTHSLYRTYPYDLSDGREDSKSRDDRVLRGGAFISHEGSVRCAYRFRLYPNSRNMLYGFRVVVSPFDPGL